MTPYSLDFLRNAHRNAMAAGDQQAADAILRQALKVAMSDAQANQANEYDPTAGNSLGQNVLEGIGRGIANVVRHVGNLANVVPDEQMAEADKLDAPLMATGGGQVGSMIGETAITAPLAMGASGGLLRLGGAAAKVAANPISRGVFEGAAQGALMANPGERGTGALMGGAFGGAIPAAGAVGGKVVRGLTRTSEADALLARGVDLTPGQMNPNGFINQLEEGWSSVPLVGDVIKRARGNAQDNFERVAIEAAAAPGARVAQGSAADMLDEAYRSFAPVYNQARGIQIPADVKAPLGQAFEAVTGTTAVPPTASKSAAGFLKSQLSRDINSTDDLLDLRSRIRDRARRLRNSPGSTPDHLDTADLLDQAEEQVTAVLNQALPPETAQALQAADAQYAKYKVLEDAVAKAKDKPGGFSAADLSRSVADANKGAAKGSYARGGGGDLRELAQAGTETLNMRSPPTGQRLAAIAIPSAAGAMEPTVGIPTGAAMLALVGTKTGRKMAAGSTAAQQRAQALVEAMQQRVPEPYRNIANQYAQRLAVAWGRN